MARRLDGRVLCGLARVLASQPRVAGFLSHRPELLERIADADASNVAQIWAILQREVAGFVVLIGYLMLLPPLLAATVFRNFFKRMGFVRYMVFINLVLLMAALPIKMVLRWSINLKYIVAIPEWFFNI